jgi:hypothetical protein
MYGKLAAGLLTLGIAMSTTMSTPAHAAVQGKTATSFQGGCSLGCAASASQAGPQPPHAEVKGHPYIKSPTHRSTRIPTGGPAPMSYTLSGSMISGYS